MASRTMIATVQNDWLHRARCRNVRLARRDGGAAAMNAERVQIVFWRVVSVGMKTRFWFGRSP